MASAEPQTDSWSQIEESALEAFGSAINRQAPGLVAVIKSSLRYSHVDHGQRQIVIDRRAFILALTAVGVQETPSMGYGNTATWFAAWLRTKSRTPEQALSPSVLTATDQVLGAFNDKLEVIISTSMKAVLPVAVQYAQSTVSRSIADLRHVVAAMMNPARTDWPEFSDFGWTPQPADIADFRKELYASIEGGKEPSESMDAWKAILIGGAQPKPPPKESSDVSGFTSDRPTGTAGAGGDPLGIEPDVQAFARLICLEEATPPLSIGLFGGWGSGKSTFMERLELAIDKLCQREAARRSSDPAPAPAPAAAASPPPLRFISRAVQVRFNAWHFADANLWASLTAEFFDQLRSGGFSRQGSEMHSRLVERVNAYVHSLSATLDASRSALADGERALVKAQKARDQAAKDAETAVGEVLSQTLVDAVGAAYEKHRTELAKIARAAGSDNPAQEIDEFIKVAKEVQTLPGQIRTVLTAVFARGWSAAVFLVGAAVALLALLTLLGGSSFTKISGIIVGLTGAAAALAPAVRIVSGIVSTTAQFADKLDQVSADRIKTVVAKEAELNAAVKEAQARRAAVDRATHALVRYIDPKGAPNPPRLLRYVLEDDPDTKALEQEIGIISRARRLFQAVDTIVKTERATRAGGNSGDAEVPDRIILYIDDLDRCTHAQVYAVLQAIHLLLAFELFVVVVGVDVNWIQESLESEVGMADYEGRPLTDDLKKEIDAQRRKRAIAYLEKIFQLPFWLRPLSVDGSRGGSYGEYVRQLLAANVAQGPQPNPPAVAGAAVAGAGASGQAAAAQAALTGPLGLAAKAREDGAGLEDALATIQLTQDEVNFLAGAEIGRLAAKEPRAVKRLVNVYRIVRARMNGDELDALLGRSGQPVAYPILVLLAAIETGQPLEVADAFYDGLRGLGPQELLDEAALPVVIPTPAPKSDPKSGKELIQKAHQLCSALAPALQSVRGLRGGGPIAAGECLTLARDLRRYSFNRYQ